MRNDLIEGNGPGTYVALDTSGIEGIWDHPTCCEAQGDGAAIVLCERESRLHGEAAIRSLEMAWQPGMRGRDRTVFDNLGPVEVPFLSPRCRGDARSPRSRLILNTVKRERKAVTLNPPANPVEHSCVGVGTRTHV